MPRPASDSRERLVDAAGVLLRQRGYQATGMADIIATSGAPRGSVYYLFPGGKEEIAVAAIRRSSAEFAGRIAEARTAPDVRSFCLGLADHLGRELTDSDFVMGCPVSTVTLDATPGSAALAEACADAYQSWLRVLESALTGYGVRRDRVPRLALLMLTAVEGALLLCRAQRSTSALREVAEELVALVSAGDMRCAMGEEHPHAGGEDEAAAWASVVDY